VGIRNIIGKGRLTTLILTIGLIVQGFMMSLHGPMAVMSALADSRGLHTVALCTPEGSQEITLDENGLPVEEGDMPAQGVNCPFCLAMYGRYCSYTAQQY